MIFPGCFIISSLLQRLWVFFMFWLCSYLRENLNSKGIPLWEPWIHSTSKIMANKILLIPKPRLHDKDSPQTPAEMTRKGSSVDSARHWSGESCNLVVEHSILIAYHSRPLWAPEIPWLLLLPHPRKIITSPCPKIKTATAWNDFSVPLRVLICLSLLPECPISQDSRQCLKCAKLLSFHLELFWLGPSLFL